MRRAGGLTGGVLDGLDALINSSLAQLTEAELPARLVLLDTVREFAQEQLAADPREAEPTRWQHARCFRRLAESSVAALQGPDEGVWTALLEREHENLRAALRWALDGAQAPGASEAPEGMCAGPGAGAGTAAAGARVHAHRPALPGAATELALRLAGALGAPGGGLGGFWASRGYLTEGRVWLAEALALPHQAPPDARAAALLAAGGLAAHQGDDAQALALLEAGVALWRRTGDGPATAGALLRLATFLQPHGEPARVHELAAEALAAFRDGSDVGGTADCLRLLGASAAALGDADGGERLLRQALRLYERAHNQRGVGVALCQLGFIAYHQRGDFAAAQRLLEQGLDALRAAGAPWWVGIWLNILGESLRAQGEYERAAACYAESLALRRELRMAGRHARPAARQPGVRQPPPARPRASRRRVRRAADHRAGTL